MTDGSSGLDLADDEDGDESGSSHLDPLFDVVADPRRRCVLRVLSDREGDVSLEELANAVAAVEHDCSASDVHPSTVDRVQISLFHAHLPKMADAGLVEFSQSSRTVSLAVPEEVTDRIERDRAPST